MRDSRKTKNIFVIMTNKCNLSCLYCYESGRNTMSADLDTVKRVLKAEFEDTNYNNFDVIFHGGEPFMEYNKVKEISEWVWMHYSYLDIQCMATTNGTLLTNEMKKWLSENNQRITLILSLDGGRETHNRNRCNSFDKIDFAFFLQNWPQQRVKMTISPSGLSCMFADILEIRDIGFGVNPSLAVEVNWDMRTAPNIFANELEKLIGYYIEHPNVYPCPMLDLSPSLLANPELVPRNKACGAGTNIVAYDVHGNRYPCHSFVTDFSKPYHAEEVNGLFRDLQTKNGVELSPQCSDCMFFPHCEPCYGMNYSRRGGMGNIAKAMCTFNKIKVKAAASMYGHMILSGKQYALLDGKDSTEISNIIAGIQNIQKMV